MSSYRFASLFAAVALCASTGSEAAGPWTLNSVLKPPAAAGYTEDSQIGFGRTVAMHGEWLAIGAPFGFCVTPAGVIDGGTVLMYRFDKASGQYVFTQQICGHGPGTSIAIWKGWLMLGWPHQDDTPGDNLQHGRISFHHLDPLLPSWNFVQTFAGATDSLMGYSVALEGGVAAAGESGYDDDRGRVRTWQLDASGASWVDEGWLYPGSTPILVNPGEGFGAYLALDVAGCRAANGCTRPHDTLIVQSKSGLHSIERLASGWGSRQLRAPASGTTTSFTPVAVNEAGALASALIPPGASVPCLSDPVIQVSTVRVFMRVPGSAHLKHRAHACLEQLGLSPTRKNVRGVAFAQGSEFVFGVPDYPANRIGSVSTWEVSGIPAVVPTDQITDPDYATAYHAAGYGSLYEPTFTGDYFGGSVAANNTRLVIGAPFYNGLISTYGAGYVMIYTR